MNNEAMPRALEAPGSMAPVATRHDAPRTHDATRSRGRSDRPPVRRRTVAAGMLWSAPVVVAAAPAAQAGLSLCQVFGSVQVGPNVTTTIRAICTAQSQWLHPGTIYANYATGSLPAYLQICNCQNADAWYRWRETDTLEEFQIEVDGVHIDQNSPAAGWRTPFFLPGFGDTGGCKQFALTYRTSVSRPRNATSVSITFTLETGPTQNGPWTHVTSRTVSGSLRRNSGSGPANVDFNSCSGGGSPNRTAAPLTLDEGSAGDGD